MELNRFQKAIREFLLKALGFPPWRGSTATLGPPGGWGAYDPYGDGGLALSLAVVYGCARVRGQSIASLPLRVYREKKSGSREIADSLPIYQILHDSPNDSDTSFEWRENMEFGFCLYGNAFSEITSLGSGITSVEYLVPSRMRIERKNGERRFVYAYDEGKQESFPPEKILHVRNMSLDGLSGITPIRQHVIEHAYDAQNYGRNFFKNSGRPSGVLSSEQPPPQSDETTKKMRESWDATFAGSENAGKTPVLWKGLKYSAISVSPDDAQYIETRKLSTAEIAGAIYGVPLNMLGLPDKSATYASSEQFARDYVMHTLRPQCRRYEQAFNKKLFVGKPSLFAEFDLDALLSGDTKSQGEYFASLVQNGIMSRDEVRRKMNLEERGNGADDLTVQLNMTDIDQLPRLSDRAAAPVGRPPEPKLAPQIHEIKVEVQPQQINVAAPHISLPAPASGPEFNVQNILPAPPPMKKRGKAWREANGTISFEVEENNVS